MSTDSLKALSANVPDWLKRLDGLTIQIEQRQQDLARLPENRPRSIAVRSMRNRGSTESLKPKDDGAAFPEPSSNVDQTSPGPAARHGPNPSATPAGGDPKPSSSLARQKQEVVATAQKRARAATRKRTKTDSMKSSEGLIPKYRTRNMVEVYYDSYVQSFFEELVKFVSSQRNAMRKAKMAAKVAHIRRLAELEMPDDDEDDDDDELKHGDGPIAADHRTLTPKQGEEGSDEFKSRYLSSRPLLSSQLRSRGGLMGTRGSRAGPLSGGLGLFKDKGDIWDELDKGLEVVQSLSEHAAHQFLRDGDCSEEIEKIKNRLAKTKEVAEKEMERLLVENPNALEEPEPERVKTRTYRPATMVRRDTGASNPKSPARANICPVEDEGVQDLDAPNPV